MPDSRPLALFDSGVGGVSVLRELAVALPHEDVLYFADAAWRPYGQRPQAQVRERSLQVGGWLADRGAKALVVACNTASAAALDALRERLNVPVVGMEPAVKPAAALTRSGRVGILATPTTAESERLARLVERYADGMQVHVQECADLAPLIERGDLDAPALEAALRSYLEPLLAERVDVVVLGCTHYPLIQGQIEAICGPGVRVLNPAPAVARQTARVLQTHHLCVPPGGRDGQVEWWTTGEPMEFSRVLAGLGYEADPRFVHLSPGRMVVG